MKHDEQRIYEALTYSRPFDSMIDDAGADIHSKFMACRYRWYVTQVSSLMPVDQMDGGLMMDVERSQTGAQPDRALIAGCDEEAAETLCYLLEILGWDVVVAPALECDHLVANELIFTNITADIPKSVPRVGLSAARIVLVGSLHELTDATTVNAEGYDILPLPINVAAAEQLIQSHRE